ncbi:hypothetical protein L1887_18371 [Cichorium endivia]|nr:hypothetical protein L1887_18371 [Cichorium endivia]
MWSFRGLENINSMSSNRSLMNNNNTTIGIQTRPSDSSSGHNPQTSSFPNENNNTEYSLEEQEHLARAKAQKEEIQYLREQITFASVKERQLLNEKYTLEKKFAELRLALDEKQNEAIEAAANELAHRKGVLDENLKLAHELKVAEDERYIFISSLVGLLAEYGILPRVTNAAALSDSIKHLHDQMQQKIRASQGQQRFAPSPYDNPTSGGHLEPFYDNSKYTPERDHTQMNNNSLIINNGQMNRSLDNDNHQRFAPRPRSQYAGYVYDSNTVNNRYEDANDGNYSQPPPINDGGDAYLEEDGPGIEGFQIIGDAKPGGKLLGCGFTVRGTSLCMFQWVRHLPDGTREYIEGATNPEYVVTADDVDKLIAVECIPMDDHGRQGQIVRLFANEQNKIMCDPEMQQEIDKYMAAGQASFSVLLLMDSSENWEQTTFTLRRSSYQVKINRTEEIFIQGKYTNDVSIKIPSGLTTQFVLTYSDGSSHPFNTFHDVRMRDTLVLTMRMFQSKALDERRKANT